MAHNEAHNQLVRETLQALALAGYTAWKNETGVWFEHDEKADDGKGRPHKYGKLGSADIIIILPVTVQFASGARRMIGWHIEAEAKTGTGRLNKNQGLHKEFCIERNGGVHITFRDIPHLLQELSALKNI